MKNKLQTSFLAALTMAAGFCCPFVGKAADGFFSENFNSMPDQTVRSSWTPWTPIGDGTSWASGGHVEQGATVAVADGVLHLTGRGNPQVKIGATDRASGGPVSSGTFTFAAKLEAGMGLWVDFKNASGMATNFSFIILTDPARPNAYLGSDNDRIKIPIARINVRNPNLKWDLATWNTYSITFNDATKTASVSINGMRIHDLSTDVAPNDGGKAKSGWRAVNWKGDVIWFSHFSSGAAANIQIDDISLSRVR